jgi:hypothetical protein
MATIVEVTIPADQFALHETFEAVGGVEFEMVRTVARGSDRVMPFLWASAGESEDLHDALRRDSSTVDVETLSQFDGEHLLELEWTSRVRLVLQILLEEGATVLDAIGRDGRWDFRILFPDHESVSKMNEFCDGYGIDLDFDRIQQLPESFRRGQFGLTDSQYATLTNAYETGFYDVPRKTTLEELAGRLDVSHQALSESMRRGHRSLIASTLHADRERAAVSR